jgi:hypothetical protein
LRRWLLRRDRLLLLRRGLLLLLRRGLLPLRRWLLLLLRRGLLLRRRLRRRGGLCRRRLRRLDARARHDWRLGGRSGRDRRLGGSGGRRRGRNFHDVQAVARIDGYPLRFVGHQRQRDKNRFSQSDHGFPPQEKLGRQRLPASSAET